MSVSEQRKHTKPPKNHMKNASMFALWVYVILCCAMFLFWFELVCFGFLGDLSITQATVTVSSVRLQWHKSTHIVIAVFFSNLNILEVAEQHKYDEIK